MTRGDIREVCSVLNDIALHLGTRQGNGERQSISENLHTITQFLGDRMTDLREAPPRQRRRPRTAEVQHRGADTITLQVRLTALLISARAQLNWMSIA